MFSANFNKHFSMVNVIFCTFGTTLIYLTSKDSFVIGMLIGLGALNVWACFYHARREVLEQIQKEKEDD